MLREVRGTFLEGKDVGQTEVSADTGTRAHKAFHAKLGEVGCCLEGYGPDQI